ncbi:26S proteasome non-ATPase regulatory subunit 2 1A [Dendrobium catenatum]|uniref:26S proteasome non-ATPase regulatory subunit 2 1A n=1 Tax=Dendrobium catenatum TaxID=906689 RepID=A0A2I0WCV0_9ASPA|nr:26S proteasome non-ATPase regulatory subunit 2 1A [Dendrobium catenatum]
MQYDDLPIDALMELVQQIVAFHMKFEDLASSLRIALLLDNIQALALLGDFIEKDDTIIRIGAILGLGIAYAGTNKDELRVRLTAILGDSKSPLEVLVFSAITLGLVHVGSCNEYIAQTIILAIMERSESELSEPLTRLLPVALGLLYLGKQVILWNDINFCANFSS